MESARLESENQITDFLHSFKFALMTRLTETEATERAMKALAERIVRLRKERGITQVDLAKALGITQPMVSRMEQGDFRISSESIVTLAKLFNVSADQILGLKIAEPTQPSISRRWLKRLVSIEKLPKRDQDGLIQTVDRYLKASDAL